MRNNRKFSEWVMNLLYPRRCPVCDEPVVWQEGLACRRCREKIRYIQEPRCRCCSKALAEETAIFCEDCRKRKHKFEYGYALYDYKSMRKSIYRFKYQGRREYAAFYAQDIYDKLGPQIKQMQAQALIPVPLHESKQYKRGYNQAELIARELSKLTHIPVASALVKRVRNTVPQKELDDVERQNNLKKAFHISPDVVKLKKVIVIDDIYTTGSTIDAVALELKQHQVGNVYFVTLCIGEGL